jgi:hypothetical protein
MEVIFDATIKMNDDDTGWYIELEDSDTGEVEKCDSMEIFEEKLDNMSEKYSGRLDEVRRSKDEDVSPFYLNEVRLGLIAMEEQINREKEELIAKNEGV